MLHPRSVLRAGLGASICLAATSPIYGQAVSATLLGTATDSSGTLLSNTSITATQEDGGLRRTDVTNRVGEFQFPDLLRGHYTIMAEHDGFDRQVETGILLEVNSTTRVSLKLVPGCTSQTMTVESSGPLLQTDRADVQTHFDAHQIEELPLYGNDNVQAILNLVPGVTRAEQLNSAFFQCAGFTLGPDKRTVEAREQLSD